MTRREREKQCNLDVIIGEVIMRYYIHKRARSKGKEEVSIVIRQRNLILV